jgi:intraflagellar transport protein 172
MYKDAQMFDDAVRIAKVHLPRLVTALQSEKMEIMARTPVAETGDWIIQQAQHFTQQKQYSLAIDHYLKVTKVHSTDIESLCRVWENAVTLALDHVHPRIHEVADIVGKRMLDVEHFEHAAEIYASVDDYKRAVESYLAGNLIDKARAFVAQSAPHLRDMVERANTVRNNPHSPFLSIVFLLLLLAMISVTETSN